MKIYNPKDGAPINELSAGGKVLFSVEEPFAVDTTVEVQDEVGRDMLIRWGFLQQVEEASEPELEPEEVVEVVVKKKAKKKGKKGK